MQDELYEMNYEMLYTGDWNMRGNSPAVPAQGNSLPCSIFLRPLLFHSLIARHIKLFTPPGGFLVIRPSIERFKEFQAIIRKGDHTERGWGGSHIGNFWGGQTIQGIIPYFYYSIHPGEALELNR